MACKCFWDSDADNFAQDVFMNVSCCLVVVDSLFQDSLFCVVAVFGVYFY